MLRGAFNTERLGLAAWLASLCSVSYHAASWLPSRSERPATAQPGPLKTMNAAGRHPAANDRIRAHRTSTTKGEPSLTIANHERHARRRRTHQTAEELSRDIVRISARWPPHCHRANKLEQAVCKSAKKTGVTRQKARPAPRGERLGDGPKPNPSKIADTA